MNQKHHNEINVLVLYQYNHKKGRGPKIIREFEKVRPDWKISGASVKPTRLSKWDQNVGNMEILDVYRDACQWFDYAIGFLTHDDRDASEAGNLWFELAYWFAVNGGDRIIVVRQDHEKVNLISDISSYPSAEVKNAEEVFREFRKLVENHRSKIATKPKVELDIYKIQEIFHATNSWKDKDFEVCQNGNSLDKHQCERVRPSLRMMAELVRFCEAESEAISLEIALKSISDQAKIIENELGDKGKIYNNSQREVLSRQFDQLYQIVKIDLAKKIDDWRRMQTKIAEPWKWDKRLRKFLIRRGIKDYGGRLRSLTASLKYFEQQKFKKSWYCELDETQGPKSGRKYDVDKKTRRQVTGLIKNISSPISDLQQYILSHSNDIETRFDNSFQYVCEPKDIASQITSCMDNFSHNIDGHHYTAPIWPQLQDIRQSKKGLRD